MSKQNVLRVGAALVVSTLAAVSAQAELVTYTIDPAQSSLSILGSVTGSPASQQTPGSLTTTFGGTVLANRTPGFIEFPGGSVLDANLQSVNQQPRADTTSGSQPADYGRMAEGPFFTELFEAFRGVILDVEDDTSGTGSPISGVNTFNSTNLVVIFDAGESDILYGNASAETDFTGLGNSNSGAGATPSSVVLSGNVETLTLRINSGPVGYSVAQTQDSDVSFLGTIVATRVVPEPTAAAALAAAGGLLALGRRARRRI